MHRVERSPSELERRQAAEIVNAVAESFFHTTKVQAFHGERTGARELLQHRVFDCIELDDDRTRPHGTLGYLGPSEFEQASQA